MVVMGADLGSGSLKCTVARVHHDGRITVLVDLPEVEIMVKHNVEMHGRITEVIVSSLRVALLESKQRAEREFQCAHCFGVATAAFRSAPNGVEVLRELERETGIRLRVVTQREEGLLGFETALSLASSSSSCERADLVALDSGGGSFQLSFYDERNDFCVVEGPWGSVSAATAILKVQGKVWAPGVTPNPVSMEQCNAAKAIIVESMGKLAGLNALAAKLSRASSRVVAIGGSTSMFRMVQMCMRDDGLRVLSHDHASKHLPALLGKSDGYLSRLGFPQPQVLLSKLVLFIAILETLLGGRTIEYEPSNGSCPGIIAAGASQTSALL